VAAVLADQVVVELRELRELAAVAAVDMDLL
jgi:hypothetical protein